MRAGRSTSAVVALAVAAAVLLAPPALAKKKVLPAEFHSCGDTIASSFRLLNNLECSGNGFTLTASNVTIDLGGHRMSSNGSGNGITISSPSTGVTVKNGVIANFSNGVLINASNGNTLTGLTFQRPTNAVIVATGDNNAIKKNTFILNSAVAVLVGAGSDGNVISANSFYGGSGAVALNGSPGAGNEVTNNKITKNKIIGSTSGAINIATAATDNTVSANTVIGGNNSGIALSSGTTGTKVSKNVIRGNGEGVFVSSSPNNTIVGNTVTGNAGNGIDISASTGTVVTNNAVRANFNDGITFDSSSTGGTIKSNKAIENGTIGIHSFAIDGVVSKNTANFNGYLNGSTNTLNFGVKVATGTASANKAKGNAAGTLPGPQCSPSTACIDGSALAPPLTTCGPVSQSITLRNPLNCSSGDALSVTTDGLTLNLGSHRVSGSSSADSVNANSHNNIAIIGGVLADSADGVDLVGQGGSVTGSIVTGQTSQSIKLNTASNSTIKKNIITRGGPSTAGVDILDGSNNLVTGNTIAALDVGVAVFGQSQSNIASKNTVAGMRIGLLADNTGANLPTDTTFSANTVIGCRDSGIFLFTAKASIVKKNVVRGSGIDATGDGIRVDGSSTQPPKGSQDGTFAGNKVTGSFHDGIVFLSQSSGNTVTGNTFFANDVDGAFAGITNSFTTNVLNENGVDGLHSQGATADITASKNTANTNGFLANPNSTDDNNGLGIDATAGSTGSGNHAKDNDNPAECQPAICV